MPFIPFASALLAIAATAPLQAQPASSKPALTIAIVLPKDAAGNSFIPHRDDLKIVLTNRSDQPMRIWAERCYAVPTPLRFRVADKDGKFQARLETPHEIDDFMDNRILTTTLAPGASVTWEPWLTDFQPLEPNTGEEISVVAIFEIKPDATTRQHGVWTGRVESAPVRGKFLNPDLKSPQDYLAADCPKQALKMLKADATWIKKRARETQYTPLHAAVANGYADVADWLLEHGADVNARAYNQLTPLLLAKDVAAVKVLIKHKVDLELGDSVSPGTALQHAASSATGETANGLVRREIAKTLLKAGAYYDIRSALYLGDDARCFTLLNQDKKLAGDMTVLFAAAGNGRAAVVKWFLDRKADPKQKDGSGYPLLYYAVEDPSVVKMLLDAGADPTVRIYYRSQAMGGSFRPTPDGYTVLHAAAEGGLVESAKLLLAHGAKTDVKCSFGETPLAWTVRGDLEAPLGGGQPGTVKLLLEQPAVQATLAKDGPGHMQTAAYHLRPGSDRAGQRAHARFQAIIDLLAAHGVPIDIYTAIVLGQTPRVQELLRADPALAKSKGADDRPLLHNAVQRNRSEIVTMLLDRGVDVNIVDEEGTSPLHAASLWYADDSARILIARKANVNAKLKNGVTPLHYARSAGMAKLLLAAGADIHAKDDKRKTPLNWAEEADRYYRVPELIELLRAAQGK